jgi:hypothetical protein
MDDDLRRVADSAASILSGSGDRTLVAAAQLGLLSAGPSDVGETPGDARPGRIAVWEARTEQGQTHYVRTQGHENVFDVGRWADVPVIPAKGDKRRVILLGESAARGHFFDPAYTPAHVLQGMLERSWGGAEVIDLAAHDLQYSELARLLTQVPALKPDALVIFAGNNWAPGAILMSAGNPTQRQLAAAALRRDGFRGLKTFLESIFAELIFKHLSALPKLAQTIGVPIVLLIPEFNLCDWKTHSHNTAPWLSQNDNARWWAEWERGERAIKADAVDAAMDGARKLLALDGGTSHHGHEVAGACFQRLGDLERARSHFEQARDARIWDPKNLGPRCYSVIQEALRRLGRSSGLRVIDLPRVFATHCQGGLPDRRLFLDYCHLTAEGIQVAMSAVVAALCPEDPSAQPRALRDAPAPTPDVEGTAHFLAAIHNAHWGQSSETVSHHLKRAVALAPGIEPLMQDYLTMQGRRVPPYMMPAVGRIAENPLAARYVVRYNRRRFYDEILLDSIAEASSQPAHAKRRLEEIRAREWSVPRDGFLDLLEPERALFFDDRLMPSPEINYFRAALPLTKFGFVLKEESPLALRVTLRTSAFFEPGGPCTLYVNGQLVATLPLAQDWRTHDLEIPPSSTHAGRNSLEFRWPQGRWASEEAIELAARELEAGRIGEYLPTFCDIHALKVMLGRAFPS